MADEAKRDDAPENTPANSTDGEGTPEKPDEELIAAQAFLATSDAYHQLTADEAEEFVDAGGVTVVDVRSAAEYADGHLRGCLHIPAVEVGATPPPALAEHQHDPVLLYCRTGSRSKKTAAKLIKMGFTNIYDMAGGILDWSGVTVGGNKG